MSALAENEQAAQNEHSSITDNLTSVESELHKLWDVVGLGSTDREKILEQLYQDVHGVIKNVLDEEKELSEQYKTRIAEAVAEIADLSAQLGSQVIADGKIDIETLTQSVNRLDIELMDTRKRHKERFDALNEKVELINHLSETLGSVVSEPFQEVGKDLTDNREKELNDHIAELQTELGNRVAARSKLVNELKNLMFELDMKCESEIDVAIMNGGEEIGVTISDLSALSNRSAELQNSKAERETQITQLASEINELWEKLSVPDEERSAFFSQHHGVGLKEILACEKELERLKVVKKERLIPLVHSTRNQILVLWDELHFCESERKAFSKMYKEDDALNETVLDEHEAYLEELEQRAEHMRPIMKNINKREKIIGDRDDLERREETGAGADRLNSRGRDAFKRLQEEEKIRARAKKLLPKINAELLKSLQAWKAKYNSPLTYNGEEYKVRMSRQAKEYADKKDQAKQRAKDLKEKQKALRNKKPQGENSKMGQSKGRKNVRKATDKGALRSKN